MCDDVDLIRAARDSGDELALALAERLEETAHLADSYDGATSELAEALRTIDYLRDEVQDMLDEIERLRAEGDTARARGDALRMALEDIAYPNPLHNEDDLMRTARAALEERT
jgi:chromosome segregation ATPase